MTAPAPILAAAQRLAKTCPCNWSADDRNAVLAYLSQGGEPPADFPMRAERTGGSYVLRKVRRPNPAQSR